jgi:hypothetical protein
MDMTLAIAIVVVALSVVVIFRIPLVEDPVVTAGCFEGLGTPPPRAKITLWTHWKWERDLHDVIKQSLRENQEQKAAAEKHGTVCFDP